MKTFSVSYKILFSTLLSAALIAGTTSCGTKDEKALLQEKQTQLEDLKKQKREIDAEIKKLEEEIKGTKKEEAKGLIVKVDTAKLQPFTHMVEVHGYVDSDKNVMIGALSSGTVLHVYVKRGQYVRKGTLLADMDSDIIVKGMSEVKTQLELATELYNKQKALWDQNIGTEVQYLSAKSQKESLEKRLASMQEQYELTRMLASIDGTVDDIMVKEGQLIGVGMPAFNIIGGTDYKVVAEIGEGHMSNVKVGNEVELVFPDINKTLKARVTTVSQAINPVNRTFTIEVDLPAGLKEIKANMITYVRIKDYSVSSVMVAPINIIQKYEDGSNFIFVAQNKKVVRKKVVVGRTYANLAEIKSGIEPGDLLVTVGYQELAEGQEVQY